MSFERNVLKSARAKIAEPEHWCRGACARSATGRPVYCTPLRTSPRATAFCLEGAIITAARETGEYGYLQFVGELRKFCGDEVADFNDSHSHAEVLAVLDAAIGFRREN